MKPIYVLLLIVVLLFVVSCDCGETKEDQFPGSWVSCIDSKPTLMSYSGDNTTVVTSDAAGAFDPQEYSCEDTQGSPVWKNSAKGVNPIFQLGTPSGPAGSLRSKTASPSTTAAYLPQLLRDLPFAAQASGTDLASLSCSASQPDVIQVNHDNASVNRISTCPFKLVTTIPVASNPLQIAITPDGSTALVTSYYNAINYINLATNQVTYTLSTPAIYPNGIAITPDGQNMYVTNFLPQNASLVEYNIATHQQVFSMAAPTYPQSVILSPDGSQLFVTFPYANQIWIIDTLTNTISYTLSISVPRDVTFNRTGTKAYISSADNPDLAVKPGQVVEFDTSLFQITNTYNVGVGPADIQMMYRDQDLIVNNYEGMSVSHIDLTTGAVNTLQLSGQPTGFAVVR